MIIKHRFFYYAFLAGCALVVSAPSTVAAESAKDAAAASSESKGTDQTAAPKTDAQPAGAPAATPAAGQPDATPAAAQPGATPAATTETPTDLYLTQRKTFADACTRICKLLREGNYDSAVYLSRHTADDLAETKVDGSDPFPKRGADLLKILKDCGPDTDALDKTFQKEAKTAEAKGDNPRAQMFFYLTDQLENGGTSKPPTPVKVVVNNEQNEDAVRQEMRLLHAVLKKYGREHNGKYPLSLDATFKKYFANITINSTKVARPFTNPFSGKPEWFEVKPIEDLGKITAMTSIPKGKVWYCPLANANDYAIIAGDHIEHQIRDPNTNQPLIISRYIVEDKTIKIPDVVAPPVTPAPGAKKPTKKK